MTPIIGVDPGVNIGGWCLMWATNKYKSGVYKKRDVLDLRRQIELAAEGILPVDSPLLYVEYTGANPVQNMHTGEVRAALGMIPYKVVRPSQWRKKIYGIGNPKDTKELACRTAGCLDHNEAEAVLIARYGWQMENKEK